ncbi:hypothetical protein OTK49_02260 [Vibrio coralliirubri]|uniref:hypothetical protein n=1 Tax=Vibrio coralliirubri TaxID=1516159 RepID=UPI002284CDEC|nr:hypothetical protein [Vibrio coralliirubri]MCY9861339.1 hypothetical protein [Vibrio coralliirubri]
MIKREIKVIDTEVELAKIHAGIDVAFAKLNDSIEKSKAALGVTERVMTHEEIEQETASANLKIASWSVAIGIQPFMLAFMSLYFS